MVIRCAFACMRMHEFFAMANASMCNSFYLSTISVCTCFCHLAQKVIRLIKLCGEHTLGTQHGEMSEKLNFPYKMPRISVM